MNRRSFITATVACMATVAPTSVFASTSFLNGELNERSKTFDWTGGGNDPLQFPWRTDGFRQSLAIERLNLSNRTKRGLQRKLKEQPAVRLDMRDIYEDKVVGDLMISGNGWIALRPRLVSSRWRSGRSTRASWWTWTDTSTWERWELLVPDVCSNLILTRLGQAVPCVCDPTKDACTL